MSSQSRLVPVDEVIRRQASLWRNSSVVKSCVRDAACRLHEHLRSRETFLLDQVEFLEHAKMESIMEYPATLMVEDDVAELDSLKRSVEEGFRPLCDAIDYFGEKKAASPFKMHRRSDSVGSFSSSDFSVLDDESGAASPRRPIVAQKEAASVPLGHAYLDATVNASDWLDAASSASANSAPATPLIEFFDESRFPRDWRRWLPTPDVDDDKMEEAPIVEDDEEADAGWERWLHPSTDGEAAIAFFSDHMESLFRSLADDWLISAKNLPPPSSPPRSVRGAVDDWLLPQKSLASTPRDVHHRHIGACTSRCRALPEAVAMEIENLDALSCIAGDAPSLSPGRRGVDRAASGSPSKLVSDWLLKPRGGRARVFLGENRKSPALTNHNKNKESNVNEWLFNEEESFSSFSTGRFIRSQIRESDWLLSASPRRDQDSITARLTSPFGRGPAGGIGLADDPSLWLIRGIEAERKQLSSLCLANETCDSFGHCLRDVNCKKEKKEDDEEKEKADEKMAEKEEEESFADAESGEWVLAGKSSSVDNLTKYRDLVKKIVENDVEVISGSNAWLMA